MVQRFNHRGQQQFEVLYPKRPPRDMTPLLRACMHNNFHAAQTFLNYGADPNLSDRFGLTALHLAAMNGTLPLALLLLSRGADWTIRDSTGKTAADRAISSDMFPSEQFLRNVKHYTFSEVGSHITGDICMCVHSKKLAKSLKLKRCDFVHASRL